MSMTIDIEFDLRVWAIGFALNPADEYATHDEFVILLGPIGVILSWEK